MKVVIVTAEPAEDLRKIPELAQSPVTILTDAVGVFEDYRVKNLPRTFFFDVRGEPVLDLEGYGPDTLRALVSRLERLPVASAARS